MTLVQSVELCSASPQGPSGKHIRKACGSMPSLAALRAYERGCPLKGIYHCHLQVRRFRSESREGARADPRPVVSNTTISTERELILVGPGLAFPAPSCRFWGIPGTPIPTPTPGT